MDYKNDFQMLNKELIYFDNAATTFKPNCVINKITEYYKEYCSNAHRGEYNISYLVDDKIDQTRQRIKTFINARKKEEIIFTSGTTDSINLVVNGFFNNVLKSGDEVILSKSEHASNILPWLSLKEKIGINIKYIPLNKDGTLKIDYLENLINNNTKVISLAHITNVVGDKRDIKKIVDITKKHNIYTVIDAAQSIGHTKIDVSFLDCDFLAFSAHKMCGPTGVGVLYGKYKLLNKILPSSMGGGMNESFTDHKIILKSLPDRLEPGTQNISSIIAFKDAVDYIDNIGLRFIEEYEINLKKYLVKELSKIEYINILNKDIPSGIIIFDIKGKYVSDVALYLNTKNICLRAGNHCVKMLKEEINFSNSVRISLYFYNNKEEIDKLISALSDKYSLYNF